MERLTRSEESDTGQGKNNPLSQCGYKHDQRGPIEAGGPIADRGEFPGRIAWTTSLDRQGWPLTKASYIAAMFFPQKPDLPVSADILGQVPRELPGRIPRSLKDVSFRIPPEQMELAETRLPEPLIDRTMKAYGFSRAEAIAAIKRFVL